MILLADSSAGLTHGASQPPVLANRHSPTSPSTTSSHGDVTGQRKRTLQHKRNQPDQVTVGGGEGKIENP